MTPTFVTMYRVLDDKMWAEEFRFVEARPPNSSYYVRWLGEGRVKECERFWVAPGAPTGGWLTNREAAIADALSKAEIRVEVCEERLRVARERLLVVQGLKR